MPPSHTTYTQQDVDAFVAWARQRLPRFALCYKDESRLQTLIGRLLKPINPHYMTLYTTVMFGKVYFPSRAHVDEWGAHRTYMILRHEFVHLMDAKRFPLLFELSYLLLLPTVFTLRAWWEYRGYVQNLIVEYESTGAISPTTIEFIIARFVGPDYGWMFPFARLLQRSFARTCEAIERGELRGPYPYKSWGQAPPSPAVERP